VKQTKRYGFRWRTVRLLVARATAPSGESGPVKMVDAPPPVSARSRHRHEVNRGNDERKGTHGARAQRGRRSLIILVVAALLMLCIAASLAVGSSTLPVGTVWNYLLHPDGTYDSYVVHTLRMQRTAIGILVGASLAVAGAIMQAVTHNPLAEPGLLGVNSGASLAVTIGAVAAGLTSIPMQFVLACAGAFLAAVMVYGLAAIAGPAASPVRLLLVGTAFSAAASAIVQALMLRHPEAFDAFRYWDVGSLSRRNVPIAAVSLIVLVGIIGAALSARGLTNISLGDDVARTLGTRVTTLRVVSIAMLTILCGISTAVAGPIGFVGLMVPLFASWLMGEHRGWIISLCLLLGPVLVLAADVVGRVIARPAEMQVGLLTAFVGSPVLLLMVMRLRERAA